MFCPPVAEECVYFLDFQMSQPLVVLILIAWHADGSISFNDIGLAGSLLVSEELAPDGLAEQREGSCNQGHATNTRVRLRVFVRGWLGNRREENKFDQVFRRFKGLRPVCYRQFATTTRKTSMSETSAVGPW